MASRAKMEQNRALRVQRGLPPETRSRAARNRRRNYLREEDVKQEIKEVENATLPLGKGGGVERQTT